MQIFSNFQLNKYNKSNFSFRGSEQGNSFQTNPIDNSSKQNNDPEITVSPDMYAKLFAASIAADKSIGDKMQKIAELEEEDSQEDFITSQAKMAAGMYIENMKIANLTMKNFLTQDEIAKVDRAPQVISMNPEAALQKISSFSENLNNPETLELVQDVLTSVADSALEGIDTPAEDESFDDGIKFFLAETVNDVAQGLNDEDGGVLGQVFAIQKAMAQCIQENYLDEFKDALAQLAKLRSFIALKSIQTAKAGNARKAINLLTNNGFIASSPTSIKDNKDGTATYEYGDFSGKLSIVRNYQNGDYISFSFVGSDGNEYTGANFRENGTIEQLRLTDSTDGSRTIIEADATGQKLKVNQAYADYYIQRELQETEAGSYKMTKMPVILMGNIS